MGDPAGIGPEILVKALANPLLRESRVIVVGDRRILHQAQSICKARIEFSPVHTFDEAAFAPGCVPLLDLEVVDMDSFRYGVISAMCGQAAYACIDKCIELALHRRVDAVATPPIHKEALRLGGIDDVGHTEIFGRLTGTPDPLTMFQVEGLRVFFLTRHVSLRQACDQITKERIMEYVARCTEALRMIGVRDGTMAVAGLNPHSGEHGLFGDEESREILPAIQSLQSAGYDVAGPVSADSVFHLARRGAFSSVLSLYHDQGHIACKTLDFDRTIALTLGMPILRTSVDHGTAFDIAGTGTASEVSMVEAIRIAELYARHFSH
ncbi:MAG: 4-hydroxythreonine-4-phosphate dehydrogenase PdxA [Clostridiales bacterium]|nr:4-hydroxythreonine-4-phosphate dehydrogenase PdxA [Clostridiales bacterium]